MIRTSLTRQFSPPKPKTKTNSTPKPTTAVAGISGPASPAPAPELMSTGLPGWPWLGSSSSALIVPTTPSRSATGPEPSLANGSHGSLIQ
ncbi:uncharacterized protein N7473_004835 [Penicillium subrubescens]|uniref:uncharacterized protein n=1 Tax=Penicillium subrubescens TaxID=1316194 RepID=UPI0025450ADC|nr:uncharacterized protein N7473_004835 [Penicillium subrubescens]KAJ5900765.1 hypothetical protein N7473_004835 [Penicillium subrubescens]